MTKRFRKLLSILCALAMLTCVFPAFAEEENTETPSQPETPETAETVEVDSPGEEDSSGTQQAVVEDLEDLPETDPEPQAEPEEEQPEELPEEPSEEIASDAMTIEEALEEEAEVEPQEPSEEQEEVPEAVEPALPAEEPAKTVDVQENNPPADEAAPPKDEPIEDKQEENEPESKPEELPEETKDEPEEETEEEPEEEPKEESEEILLNLNGQTSISGELTRETPFTFTASDDYFRTVVFTLTVPEEDSVSVTLNDNPVTLDKIENNNPDTDGVKYAFERTLVQNQVYSIVLKTDEEGTISFSIAISEKREEPEIGESTQADENVLEEEENASGILQEIKEAQKDTENADFGLENPNEQTDVSEDTDETEDMNETELPDSFSISFGVTWDGEELLFGDTAHFVATVTGAEETPYILCWQWSTDNENWVTIENEHDLQMDVVVTKDNYLNYWRVKAEPVGSYQEQDQL